MNVPALSLVFAILLCGHAVLGVTYTYHRPSTKRVTTPKPVVIDAVKLEMQVFAKAAVSEITKIENIHTELVEIVQTSHHYGLHAPYGLFASLKLRVRMDSKPFVCNVTAFEHPMSHNPIVESFACKPDPAT